MSFEMSTETTSADAAVSVSNQPMAALRSFPPKVSAINAGTIEHDFGFQNRADHEEVHNHLDVCYFCGGVPRLPILNRKCSHVSCESCFTLSLKLAQMQSAASPFKCGYCKEEMFLTDILTEAEMVPFIQRKFNEAIVKCPLCNLFKGSPKEVHKHQVTECENRIVLCTNDGCDVRGPAKEMADGHFQGCTHYKIYCGTCKLPVPESHVCEPTMKQAIDGMQVSFITFFQLICNTY